MAIPHRQSTAALNGGTPPSRRPGLASRRRERAKAMAVYGLAWLATLGLAGTGAAHYGGGLKSASAGPGGGPGCRAATDANAGCARARGQTPRLRLAYGGDSPFVAFLKGLLGVEPPDEPRRWPPREQRVPRRALPPIEPPTETPGVETYRTMCVRLCDGYYWPVSFATARESFERDQRTCTRSCGSSVALYYYPNPGGALEDMVNLQGQPYKSLGTAFVYRTTYDANCKCRPHPWEARAIERHKSYAKPAAVRAVSRRARRRR